MDVALFQHSPMGSLVAVTIVDRGDRYEHFAFVPANLPKSIPLTGRLQRRLEEAAVAVGRLDGRAQELPNPQLLARPAIREEAVSTSALEGTYSTLPQAFEAEFLEEDELDRAAREVRNYVWAAENAYRRILGEGHPLTLRLIREFHGILMDGTGGSPSDVTQFRNRQNWIGPRRNSTILESTFVPPPSGYHLKTGLEQWEKWIHDEDIPLLIRVALGHYQFETLHPFIDGNGRMGRLVAQLQLMEGGALSQPMLNLSPYLQRRADEYRQELRAVSATGDLERWILFFLDAVTTQAKAAVTRARRLLELRSEMLTQVRTARISGVALRITEGLVEYPAVTPTTASQQYGVTYQAANTAIDRLVKIGLLQEVTGKRYGRLFLAMRVISLLEDVTSGREG